jgi:hypothetical protein
LKKKGRNNKPSDRPTEKTRTKNKKDPTRNTEMSRAGKGGQKRGVLSTEEKKGRMGGRRIMKSSSVYLSCSSVCWPSFEAQTDACCSVFFLGSCFPTSCESMCFSVVKKSVVFTLCGCVGKKTKRHSRNAMKRSRKPRIVRQRKSSNDHDRDRVPQPRSP